MLPSLKCKVWPYFDSHIDGSTFNFVRIFFFGKEGNTTNKSLIFLNFVWHKVSNDISNIDHFVSIHISYRKI